MHEFKISFKNPKLILFEYGFENVLYTSYFYLKDTYEVSKPLVLIVSWFTQNLLININLIYII